MPALADARAAAADALAALQQIEQLVTAEVDRVEDESGWDYQEPVPPRLEVLGEVVKCVNQAKSSVSQARDLADLYDTIFKDLPPKVWRCALCSEGFETRIAYAKHFEKKHLRNTLEEARARAKAISGWLGLTAILGQLPTQH